MARCKQSIVVEHVVHLLLNDQLVSQLCIDTANQVVGRPCYPADDIGDFKWWDAHNKAMIELLIACAKQFR